MFNPQCHTGPPLRYAPVIRCKGTNKQREHQMFLCFFLSERDIIGTLGTEPNTHPKSLERPLYKGFEKGWVLLEHPPQHYT